MPVSQTYSFKSVGEKYTDSLSRNQNVSSAPIGIKTPCEFGEGHEGLLKMHTNVGDVISDNFRNMIMTNWGERLMQYDFGANLTDLAFQLGQESIDEEAIRRISKTTSKYMPYIDLDQFEPFIEKNVLDDDINKVGIRITYNVPAAGIVKRRLEVVIYAVT